MIRKIIPWEVDVNSFSDEYIAGFLDGDGSIVATVEHRPERRRFPYRVRLKISLTQHSRHKHIIEAMQQFLGGVGNIRNVATHNIVELVILDRKELVVTLKRLRPFIVIKRKQAAIMDEILLIYEGATVNTRSSLSESEFAIIMKKVKEIRNLNSNTGGKIKLL